MFRHLESTQNSQKFKLFTILLSFCDTFVFCIKNRYHEHITSNYRANNNLKNWNDSIC